MMAVYANVESRVGQVHNHELYSKSFLDQSLSEFEKKIEELE
jgi:hypothetical protein